jgi:hypothetical protein
MLCVMICSRLGLCCVAFTTRSIYHHSFIIQCTIPVGTLHGPCRLSVLNYSCIKVQLYHTIRVALLLYWTSLVLFYFRSYDSCAWQIRPEFAGRCTRREKSALVRAPRRRTQSCRDRWPVCRDLRSNCRQAFGFP